MHQKLLGLPISLCIGGFIPLLLWAMAEPFGYKFVGNTTILLTFGQLTGLVGLGLFAVSMILSSRLSSFEAWFGGMNRVYIAHHQLGGIAFILLMIHPLLLMFPHAGPTFHGMIGFLLPGIDWTINVGIAALVTLMSLLMITYYFELPYEVWRFTHKFLGIPFFLGGLHSLYVASDISRNPILQAYMIGICGLGIIGYLYRTVFGRWFVPRFTYVVDTIFQTAPNVLDIILKPQGEKFMTFVPGQFIFITFKIPGKAPETHPFSISSSPNPQGFRLSIKELGDYTNDLSKLPKGSTAMVEGPFGRFSYYFEPSRQYIWIGGGIGVTPFISMAGAFPDITAHVDLYYCVSTKEEAVYMTELLLIADRHPNVRIIEWCSKEKGRLTADHIASFSNPLTDKEVFICGPPAMMYTLRNQLKRSGVKGSKIHMEEFGFV